MAETRKDADEPKAAKADPKPVAPEPRAEPVAKTPDGMRERGETARPLGPVIPTGKEVEEVRKAHFGDKPGAVLIDTDTDPVTLVFVDRTGKQVARQSWRKGGK